MKNFCTYLIISVIAFLNSPVETIAQTTPGSKKVPSLASPINTDTGQKNDKQPKTDGQNNTSPSNQAPGNKNTGSPSGTKQTGQTNTKGNSAGAGSSKDKPSSGNTPPKEEPVRPKEKTEPAKEEPKQSKETNEAERKQTNIANTKKQLIADGYELCVEHPKYGSVYCKETENKYFYIDADGIATPVKKSLVVTEAASAKRDKKQTTEEQGTKPGTGFNPRPAERVINPGEINGWKAVNNDLIASWPLENSASDVSGKQQAVTTNKTTFQGGALWCPGNNGGTDPYGSAMLAPTIQGLNLNNFTIKFDFYTPNIQRQPIVIIGTGCRWFGAEMDADGSMAMLVNNVDRTSTGVKFNAGQWNTVQLKYANGNAQMLLNGQVISSKNVQFDLGPCGTGDTRIGTSNYSNASAYTGYIRNLQVFSY
jgi:hypothetical protein